MRTQEGKRLAEFIDDALAFFACVLFIAAGMMTWIAFRPDIQDALRVAQGWLFG